MTDKKPDIVDYLGRYLDFIKDKAPNGLPESVIFKYGTIVYIFDGEDDDLKYSGITQDYIDIVQSIVIQDPELLERILTSTNKYINTEINNISCEHTRDLCLKALEKIMYRNTTDADSSKVLIDYNLELITYSDNKSFALLADTYDNKVLYDIITPRILGTISSDMKFRPLS